jgi:hypothetical protein
LKESRSACRYFNRANFAAKHATVCLAEALEKMGTPRFCFDMCKRDHFRPLQDVSLLSLAIQTTGLMTAIAYLHCAPSVAANATLEESAGQRGK